MNSIKDLLSKNQSEEETTIDVSKLTDREYAELKCKWYNDEIGNLNLTDGINCDICHNKGKIAYVDKDGYEIEKDCECMKQRRTLIRLNKCGITKTMLEHYTFANYKCTKEWQKTVKEKFLNYCEDIKNNKKYWLCFCGQSGVGKTHLCTATFQKLIKSDMNGEYLLWNEEVPKILALEKSSYDDNQIKYEARIKFLQNVDLLYIDDFLKLTNNKYNVDSISLAYKIINSRYNNDKITIISTEYSVSQLFEIEEAIYGRIREKANKVYLFGCAKDNDNKLESKNYRLNGE